MIDDNLLLQTLKNISDQQQDLYEKVNDISKDFANFKGKIYGMAAFIAFFVGFLGSILSNISDWLKL